MKVDLKNALDLKGGLNGLKMVMGATLIIFSHQLAAVNEIMPLVPGAQTALQTIATGLHTAVGFLEDAVNLSGNALLGVGFVHKFFKLFGVDVKGK